MLPTGHLRKTPSKQMELDVEFQRKAGADDRNVEPLKPISIDSSDLARLRALREEGVNGRACMYFSFLYWVAGKSADSCLQSLQKFSA
ncbi:hypothetical protein J1605_022872 [Eschrichtius robustus]|uniref:Uncharacterized protein n=1 Tax=Eschrichtius robustus TaxID=9764 RepID=A0AB34H7Z3_ESCRO|nr:hypothetical protein J1605_022872 [Eschrichtius robustus]